MLLILCILKSPKGFAFSLLESGEPNNSCMGLYLSGLLISVRPAPFFFLEEVFKK